MVRLITQNLLSCPSRACAYPTNFPLSFRNVERIEMTDAEFNEEFLRGVLSRLEWAALRKSAAEVRRNDYPGTCEGCETQNRPHTEVGATLQLVEGAVQDPQLQHLKALRPCKAVCSDDEVLEGAAVLLAEPRLELLRTLLLFDLPLPAQPNHFAAFVPSRAVADHVHRLPEQLGNTDLPEQSPDLTQPDAISLDLLKTLHHVLLEVRCVSLTYLCNFSEATVADVIGEPNADCGCRR